MGNWYYVCTLMCKGGIVADLEFGQTEYVLTYCPRICTSRVAAVSMVCHVSAGSGPSLTVNELALYAGGAVPPDGQPFPVATRSTFWCTHLAGVSAVEMKAWPKPSTK